MPHTLEGSEKRPKRLDEFTAQEFIALGAEFEASLPVEERGPRATGSPGRFELGKRVAEKRFAEETKAFDVAKEKEAARKERERAGGRTGRASTLVTGGRGVTGDQPGVSLTRRTLLGV